MSMNLRLDARLAAADTTRHMLAASAAAGTAEAGTASVTSPDALPFAVRLEVQADPHHVNRTVSQLNGWSATGVASDCSHNRTWDNGRPYARVQSPAGLTMGTGGLDQIRGALDKLSQAGANPGKTGALHILLPRASMDDRATGRYMRMFMAYEDILYRLGQQGEAGRGLRHKTEGGFARSLVASLGTGSLPSTSRDWARRLQYHTHAINASTAGQWELRYLDSTLNPAAVHANIKLLAGMVGAAQSQQADWSERHEASPRNFDQPVSRARWNGLMRAAGVSPELRQQLEDMFISAGGSIAGLPAATSRCLDKLLADYRLVDASGQNLGSCRAIEQNMDDHGELTLHAPQGAPLQLSFDQLFEYAKAQQGEGDIKTTARSSAAAQLLQAGATFVDTRNGQTLSLPAVAVLAETSDRVRLRRGADDLVIDKENGLRDYLETQVQYPEKYASLDDTQRARVDSAIELVRAGWQVSRGRQTVEPGRPAFIDALMDSEVYVTRGQTSARVARSAFTDTVRAELGQLDGFSAERRADLEFLKSMSSRGIAFAQRDRNGYAYEAPLALDRAVAFADGRLLAKTEQGSHVTVDRELLTDLTHLLDGHADQLDPAKQALLADAHELGAYGYTLSSGRTSASDIEVLAADRNKTSLTINSPVGQWHQVKNLRAEAAGPLQRYRAAIDTLLTDHHIEANQQPLTTRQSVVEALTARQSLTVSLPARGRVTMGAKAFLEYAQAQTGGLDELSAAVRARLETARQAEAAGVTFSLVRGGERLNPAATAVLTGERGAVAMRSGERSSEINEDSRYVGQTMKGFLETGVEVPRLMETLSAEQRERVELARALSEARYGLKNANGQTLEPSRLDLVRAVAADKDLTVTSGYYDEITVPAADFARFAKFELNRTSGMPQETLLDVGRIRALRSANYTLGAGKKTHHFVVESFDALQKDELVLKQERREALPVDRTLADELVAQHKGTGGRDHEAVRQLLADAKKLNAAGFYVVGMDGTQTATAPELIAAALGKATVTVCDPLGGTHAAGPDLSAQAEKFLEPLQQASDEQLRSARALVNVARQVGEDLRANEAKVTQSEQIPWLLSTGHEVRLLGQRMRDWNHVKHVVRCQANEVNGADGQSLAALSRLSYNQVPYYSVQGQAPSRLKADLLDMLRGDGLKIKLPKRAWWSGYRTEVHVKGDRSLQKTTGRICDPSLWDGVKEQVKSLFSFDDIFGGGSGSGGGGGYRGGGGYGGRYDRYK
jgi:hypothetical protein